MPKTVLSPIRRLYISSQLSTPLPFGQVISSPLLMTAARPLIYPTPITPCTSKKGHVSAIGQVKVALDVAAYPHRWKETLALEVPRLVTSNLPVPPESRCDVMLGTT